MSGIMNMVLGTFSAGEYVLSHSLTTHSTNTSLSTTSWSDSVTGVSSVPTPGARHIIVASTMRDSDGLTNTDWLTSLSVNGNACTLFKAYSSYNGAALGIVTADVSGTLTLDASGTVTMEGGYHFTVWVIDGPKSYTTSSAVLNDVTTNQAMVASPGAGALGSSAFFCAGTSNSTAAATLTPNDGKTWVNDFSLDTGTTEFSSSYHSENYNLASYDIDVDFKDPNDGAGAVLLGVQWN